jgi:hypothetical protein
MGSWRSFSYEFNSDRLSCPACRSDTDSDTYRWDITSEECPTDADGWRWGLLGNSQFALLHDSSLAHQSSKPLQVPQGCLRT